MEPNVNDSRSSPHVQSLKPILKQIIKWGLEHIPGTSTQAAEDYLTAKREARQNKGKG